MKNTIDLSGTWKIIPSDIKDASHPNFDDSSYRNIHLPGGWGKYLDVKNLSGTFWLRKKIHIPSEFPREILILSLGEIAVSDVTYFNGVEIGSNGTIPADINNPEYVFTWKNYRVYTIHKNLIKYNKENIIAIRVFSHLIHGIKGNLLITTFNKWLFHFKYDPILTPLLFVLSIAIMSILFIVQLIAFKNTNSIANRFKLLLFLLISSITGIYLFVLDIPQISSGFIRYKAIAILLSLACSVYIQLVHNFLKATHWWALPVNYCAFTLVSLFAIFAPNESFLDSYTTIIFIIQILYTSVYTTIIFYRAFFRNTGRYWNLILSNLILLMNISVLIYFFLERNYHFMPIYILLSIGPIIMTTALIVEILNLKYNIKSNDVIIKTLNRKSENLKNMAPAIIKINTKPEPRVIIIDIIHFLNKNFTERYERKELAAKFAINDRYMCELFRKQTGTTISSYINTKRIELAKDIILKSDSKIIDIAFHVGFDNLPYFYRVFKNSVGITPGRYRYSGPDTDQ